MQYLIGMRVKIVYGALRLETVGEQPKSVMDHSSGSERYSTIAFATGQVKQAQAGGLTSVNFGLD
jgi:hypothetical protein